MLADVFARLQPRQPHGISAVLLPFTASQQIDWKAFLRLVLHTKASGLDVAVNMDTGFGDLLTAAEREAVLDATQDALGVGIRFYAGAFPNAEGDVPSYHNAMQAIAKRGAIPVLIQSPAMHAMSPREKANLYRRICAGAEKVLGFELSPVFAAHGEIWDDESFARILEIPQMIGAKHSSLHRDIELRRLSARDQLRPQFKVYTGNDLAIDMVAYGSDYLLGLSTFAPHAFAARDKALADGDVSFLERNDALQHLGNVGFRAPVPAYKHAAAQFLNITGQLDADHIHPRAPRRPASERILLFDCARRLGLLDDPERAYRERVAPYLVEV